MTSPPIHFYLPDFFIFYSTCLPRPHFLSFSSAFPSSLRISYLHTENKKKNRITFTVKVEQYPRGLDDRLFSASCYYFWCTSRGKSWMELTIRLSGSINQWQRNYIRSPVWAEGAGMLVLLVTEWGSSNKTSGYTEYLFLFRDQVQQRTWSASRSFARAQLSSSCFRLRLSKSKQQNYRTVTFSSRTQTELGEYTKQHRMAWKQTLWIYHVRSLISCKVIKTWWGF